MWESYLNKTMDIRKNIKKEKYNNYLDDRVRLDRQFIEYMREQRMYYFKTIGVITRVYARVFTILFYGFLLYVYKCFMKLMVVESRLYGMFYIASFYVYLCMLKIYIKLNDKTNRAIFKILIRIKNKLLAILFFTGNYQFFRYSDFYFHGKTPYYFTWKFYHEYPDRHDPTFYQIFKLL